MPNDELNPTHNPPWFEHDPMHPGKRPDEPQSTAIVDDFEMLRLPPGSSIRLGYQLGKKIASGCRYPLGCLHGSIFVAGSEPARLLAAADDQEAFFRGVALGVRQ